MPAYRTVRPQVRMVPRRVGATPARERWSVPRLVRLAGRSVEAGEGGNADGVAGSSLFSALS
jgi:hypothetical protein